MELNSFSQSTYKIVISKVWDSNISIQLLMTHSLPITRNGKLSQSSSSTISSFSTIFKNWKSLLSSCCSYSTHSSTSSRIVEFSTCLVFICFFRLLNNLNSFPHSEQWNQPARKIKNSKLKLKLYNLFILCGSTYWELHKIWYSFVTISLAIYAQLFL